MQSPKKVESESIDHLVTGVTSKPQEVGSVTATAGTAGTTALDVFRRRALAASEKGRVNVSSGLTQGFQRSDAGRVSVSPVSSQGLEDTARNNPDKPDPPSTPSSLSPVFPLSRTITPAATSVHLFHFNRLKQLIDPGRSTAADVCHAHRGWGGTTACTPELSLRSCPDDYEWQVICSAHDPEWAKRGECTRYSDIALRQERQEAVGWKEVDWRT
jgi:hypothetical protein